MNLVIYSLFQVNNGATSSSYVIDASNTNATLDNGMYTCQATLNVAGEDNFTSFSNSATVGLRGTAVLNIHIHLIDNSNNNTSVKKNKCL